MGQKVNPVGYRLGVNKDWDSRWYAKKDYADYLNKDINLDLFNLTITLKKKSLLIKCCSFNFLAIVLVDIPLGIVNSILALEWVSTGLLEYS